MNNQSKSTALLILHNEESIVKRALESVKGIVDEIFVIHDGKCTDNTLKICKKYTKKVFTRPHTGRASLHMIFAFKKIKTEWILKIDADEFLSEKLRKNFKILLNNPKADGYLLLWKWWDGKKYITKNFPHKMALFRKSKISYLNFPGNDEPEVSGNLIQTNLHLEHQPNYNNFSWKNLMKRGHKRAKDQAEWTLKDFKKLEKFQYHKNDFKWALRFRRDHTFLAFLIFPSTAFLKIMSSGWKEGWPILKFAIADFIYQGVVCLKIMKLKSEKIKNG